MPRSPRDALVALTLFLAGCGGDDEPSPAADPPAPVTAEELARGGDCPAPAGAGTMHAGFVDADETWTEAGSPHVVTSDLTIRATVTLGPCTRVRLPGGVVVTVGSSTDVGRLVAAGEVVGSGSSRRVRPVLFERLEASEPWGQLALRERGTADLSVTRLMGGGQPVVGLQGALVTSGPAGGTNDGPVTRALRVQGVLVEASATHGVVLDGWSTFTADSRDLFIRSSGGEDSPEAIALEPGIAATLPVGLSLTGNRQDAIRVETNKTFLRDDTLVDRGYPYRVFGTIYVNPFEEGPPATLRVEPGVTLAFGPEGGVAVGSTRERRGVLVAEGTATAPITFESSARVPAAGDWLGVVYRYIPLLGNRLVHGRVRHAGGPSGTIGFGCGPANNDAALIIWGQDDPSTPDLVESGPPGEVFVRDTSFDQIGGMTVIVSGWTSDAGPSFAPTNTFGPSTGPCKVSQPERSGGGDVCDGGREMCFD